MVPLFKSTILPQSADPVEAQKASLDLLKKINDAHSLSTAGQDGLQASIDALTKALNDSLPIYGSNSNGEYLKLSNGVLFQWGVSTQNISVTNSVGSGFYGLGSAVVFPLDFVGSLPSLNVSGSVLYATSFSSLTLHQFNINATYFASSTGLFGYTWQAIGKWK